MTPDQHLLTRIADRITGIAFGDLTKAEKQIATLLLNAGYLKKSEHDYYRDTD